MKQNEESLKREGMRLRHAFTGLSGWHEPGHGWNRLGKDGEDIYGSEGKELKSGGKMERRLLLVG